MVILIKILANEVFYTITINEVFEGIFQISFAEKKIVFDFAGAIGASEMM